MTRSSTKPRAGLTNRWPTALALVTVVGAVAVIALLDRDAELFGPAVATMAGIYLVAYALGRPWTAWPAFVALSVVVTVLQLVHLHPAIGMTALLVPLWLWAVARGRATDTATFRIQTAGMVAFGAITLLCAAVDPRLGGALAGIGFLAHGTWDAYHFAVDKVVNRPWSEFCGVVDFVVGTSLVVAAIT